MRCVPRGVFVRKARLPARCSGKETEHDRTCQIRRESFSLECLIHTVKTGTGLQEDKQHN